MSLSLSTRKERERLRATERYIVQDIFPCGEIHLIGGPSGAGKTTWLFQWLKDWSEGKDVFGKRSYPCSYAYIMIDRGLLATDRTMRRLGIEDWDLPAYPIEDLVKGEFSIDAIARRLPEVDLFVIEGFQAIIPDPTKRTQNKSDMLFMSDIRKQWLSKGKTVIGVTHSPKLKIGEEYENSRSKILGSTSLIACCSTIVSFELPPDVKSAAKPRETDERQVIIRGRDIPDMKLDYTRDHRGRFVLTSEMPGQRVSFEIWLDAHEKGHTFTTEDLVDFAKSAGISRPTVYRWIKALIDDKKLERIKAGQGGGTEGLFRKLAPKGSMLM
jgi:hypothetical protein